jgi:DNA-binding CsgD family transcriptional regulator
MEILELLCQGLTIDTIAQDLNISKYTVRRHLSSVYEKLNARNQVQAVALYLGSLLQIESKSYILANTSKKGQAIHYLSNKEKIIYALAAQSLAPKQIAAIIEVSPSTVRNHMVRIRRKLPLDPA